MGNRYKNALHIQQGACNTRAVAAALVEACDEVMAETASTAATYNDPAIRMIVHQLAHLCKVDRIMDLSVYDSLQKACKLRA